jgi:hypothetical protein
MSVTKVHFRGENRSMGTTRLTADRLLGERATIGAAPPGSTRSVNLTDQSPYTYYAHEKNAYSSNTSPLIRLMA